MNLDLAPGLALPAAQAGTQTYGFVARKGGGKSYAASKLAELLHGAGVPIIAIDPVGIWWGLRLGADGTSPGLPIPVIGGQHGDVELPPDEEGLAARLATWLIGSNASVVLDVSEMRKAERKRFMAEFAEAFFHAAKGKRRPRMVILEEAQVFAPQMAKGQERMLGAIEDIVRLGRNYGIGAMQRVVLTVMVRQVRTRTITAGALAKASINPATGEPYEANGGGFRNSLSHLRGLGLIQGKPDAIALGADIAKDLLS